MGKSQIPFLDSLHSLAYYKEISATNFNTSHVKHRLKFTKSLLNFIISVLSNVLNFMIVLLHFSSVWQILTKNIDVTKALILGLNCKYSR